MNHRNDGRRAIDKQRALQHYSDQQRIAELEKALKETNAVIKFQHVLQPDWGWQEWLDEHVTPVLPKE